MLLKLWVLLSMEKYVQQKIMQIFKAVGSNGFTIISCIAEGKVEFCAETRNLFLLNF